MSCTRSNRFTRQTSNWMTIENVTLFRFQFSFFHQTKQASDLSGFAPNHMHGNHCTKILFCVPSKGYSKVFVLAYSWIAENRKGWRYPKNYLKKTAGRETYGDTVSSTRSMLHVRLKSSDISHICSFMFPKILAWVDTASTNTFTNHSSFRIPTVNILLIFLAQKSPITSCTVIGVWDTWLLFKRSTMSLHILLSIFCD